MIFSKLKKNHHVDCGKSFTMENPRGREQWKGGEEKCSGAGQLADASELPGGVKFSN